MGAEPSQPRQDNAPSHKLSYQIEAVKKFFNRVGRDWLGKLTGRIQGPSNVGSDLLGEWLGECLPTMRAYHGFAPRYPPFPPFLPLYNFPIDGCVASCPSVYPWIRPSPRLVRSTKGTRHRKTAAIIVRSSRHIFRPSHRARQCRSRLHALQIGLQFHGCLCR